MLHVYLTLIHVVHAGEIGQVKATCLLTHEDACRTSAAVASSCMNHAAAPLKKAVSTPQMQQPVHVWSPLPWPQEQPQQSSDISTAQLDKTEAASLVRVEAPSP